MTKRKGDDCTEATAKTVVVRGSSPSRQSSLSPPLARPPPPPSSTTSSTSGASPTPHDILSSTASPTISLTPRANLFSNFEIGGGKESTTIGAAEKEGGGGGSGGEDDDDARAEAALHSSAGTATTAATAATERSNDDDDDDDDDKTANADNKKGGTAGRGSPDCVLAIGTWEESLEVMQHFVSQSNREEEEEYQGEIRQCLSLVQQAEARPAALKAKAQEFAQELREKIAQAKAARRREWQEWRQQEAACAAMERQAKDLELQLQQKQQALIHSRQCTQAYKLQAQEGVQEVADLQLRLRAQIRKHLTTIELYAKCTGVKFDYDNDDEENDNQDEKNRGTTTNHGPRLGTRCISHLRGEIECPSKATLRRFSISVQDCSSSEIAQRLWNLIRGEEEEKACATVDKPSPLLQPCFN